MCLLHWTVAFLFIYIVLVMKTNKRRTIFPHEALKIPKWSIKWMKNLSCSSWFVDVDSSNCITLLLSKIKISY